MSDSSPKTFRDALAAYDHRGVRFPRDVGHLGRLAAGVANDVDTHCELAEGIAIGIADGSLESGLGSRDADLWVHARVDELAASAADAETRQLVAILRAELAAREEILRVARLVRRGEFPP